LYPECFVSIDLLYGIRGRAAKPVIDQGFRIDENFCIEGFGSLALGTSHLVLPE